MAASEHYKALCEELIACFPLIRSGLHRKRTHYLVGRGNRQQGVVISFLRKK
jgi:hypothetical protein